MIDFFQYTYYVLDFSNVLFVFSVFVIIEKYSLSQKSNSHMEKNMIVLKYYFFMLLCEFYY